MGVLLCGILMNQRASSQDSNPDAARAILSRSMPNYPDLAKRMNIEGTVRIRVTIAPNGTVKTAETIGGSPLLVKSAENAIYKWRWIPSRQESKQIVEMRFHQ
jgi:TonB family protein